MADITVNPGGFVSAYSTAVSGDRLLLQPGLHNLGTSRFSFSKSGITVEAAASSWSPGRWVTNANGHDISTVPVRLRGNMTISGSNNAFRGFGWYDATVTGPGTCLITGSNNVFEDLVCRNRFTTAYVDGSVSTTTAGSIYFNILSTSGTPTGNIWRRVRWRLCGDPTRNDHDHPLYFGNGLNSLVEDCISYEQTDGWFVHFYPNADGTLVRRCVAYNVSGGVTFSGGTEPTTGCQASSNNIVENTILMRGTRRWLLESYWGCATIGTGNIVRNCDIYQPSGSGGAGRISTAGGGFTTSNILNSDPLFTDAANGNFMLASNSPALGMGPTQIQPGGAPPTPPDPVTTFTATAGNAQVALSWGAVASVDGYVINRYVGTGGAQGINDGTRVYDSTGTSFTDTGLTNDQVYTWGIWTKSGGLFSSSGKYVSATPSAGTPPPPPPPPDEPFPGATTFGKTTIGATWRGMSGDYKRASVFNVPAIQRITAIGVRMRGTGTTGTQACRAFAYDAGTKALLGVTAAQSLSNALAEQWVIFTPASPINCPTNGGAVMLGLHTGSGTGELQIATDIVTGGLIHGADTYADGTADPFGTEATDQYEISICASIEAVPASSALSGAGSISFIASADITEVTPGSTAITDVVYRMVTLVRTYSIPTPFQISTGAELEWDSVNSRFIYKESD